MSIVEQSSGTLRRRASHVPWTLETSVFTVVAVVVLVATPLGLGELDTADQLRLVAVPALLLGLPHGALDPVLARRLGLWDGTAGAVGFHTAYLALVGVTVAAFLLLPTVSLVLFLAATAWHFAADQRDAAGPWTRLPVGVALVSLPAVARPGQVGELYALVTTPAAAGIADAQARLGPLVLATLGVALVVLWRRQRRAAVEVTLACALGLVAPPLVFFAAYFALLHAPRHLRETGMASSRGAARTMLLYSLLAAGGLGVAGVLLAPRSGIDAAIAATVFVGLAALTTPHMLLVERAARTRVLDAPD